MTDQKFLEILKRPESSILDFKAELYDFGNDTDKSVTAKFVKDVLAFSNTIRTETAYIIFVVKELPNNSKQKIGISSRLDDAILQDKVKTKLYPIPQFSFSIKDYQGKTFGILEFPIVKYEFPVTSTERLKGIELGKVYYRQSTANTEALSLDVIKINIWLQSLPASVPHISKQIEVSNILK